MAAGDSALVATQTRAQYITSSSKLIGEAFDAMLDVSMSNSNILDQLQGPENSDAPFVVKRELEAGARDTVNFSVGTTLGQAGRRGLQRAVNYEEGLIHNSWPVQVDNLRVVVAWNELLRWAATTGASWQSVYPKLCGQRAGQIEQEDALVRLRMRSSSLNTIRPGTATSLDTLKYSDTVDTQTMGRGYNLLTINGAKPAKIGRMKGGMELKKYVCLGANLALEGLWLDPAFTEPLQRCLIEGPTNPFWTNDLPDWRGMIIKRWDIVNHDNPGPIGSSIIPQASLGDSVAGGTIASAINIYGGGRTQSSLGDAATLYKPFELFYGTTKLFGESITSGTDSGTYYAVIIDPADGKWTMFSYVGSDVASNGHSILVTARLHSSTTGTGVTTLGGVTYDSSVNKTGTFPAGSIIVQVNANAVPVTDIYLFGANAGAKCYGTEKNKPIQNTDDYGALMGKGIWSIYGQDMAKDVNGLYHRRFVRIQAAYEHPQGVNLPKI